MDSIWRFRLMLFTAFAVIMFGDLLGFSGIKVVKSSSGRDPTTLKENQPNLEIDEDSSLTAEISPTLSTVTNYKTGKHQLAETIREACLPKMLCEMASRPSHMLSDKEKDLLNLIRSTNLLLAMNNKPTRWHFAVHFGELFQHTVDGISGPAGCANLWPQCPFNSKKLMRLSYKVNLL